VTNKGKLPHSFKVCTSPGAGDKPNSCTGVATKMLAPGGTATLIVKLAKSGTYEYLSGSAAQAAKGMKGTLAVQLPKSSSTGSSTPTPTGGGTSTTPQSSGTGGGGGVVNGAATDPACPTGVTIAVGPGAGDQDDDNEGGFPTDGDGCV